jgi:hypothetical protein
MGIHSTQESYTKAPLPVGGMLHNVTTKLLSIEAMGRENTYSYQLHTTVKTTHIKHEKTK